MHPKLRAVLQYLLMIAIAAALLWLSLRGLPTGEGEGKSDLLWHAWQKANKGYLLLYAGLLILSHLLRAERWRMLLAPTNYPVKLSSSFLSVLIGYLVNLAIPRGGEVSRCYNLFKLEGTPVEVSFGTVVVERIIDVFCLLLLILLSFIIEWDKLQGFISTLNFGGAQKTSVPLWLIVALTCVALLVILIYVFRKNQKLRKLLFGFKEGLVSIFHLKNKWLFVFHSVMIWLLYFITSYCVMLAFEETAVLGMRAVLTIFAIGAIAMAAPLPGGTGSYHVLLPIGLVSLYHMERPDAVAFVFIFHAWQTVTLVVAGLLSLFISYLLIRWKRPAIK